MAPLKIIAFDCDSTLSAIEGIDELGRSRGPEVFAAVEAMTNDAMNGKLAIEAVFGRRLEIINPRRADAEAVARRYLATVEPTAQATITILKTRGWTPIIISGGFRPLIGPLAAQLGISRIEAVDIFLTRMVATAATTPRIPPRGRVESRKLFRRSSVSWRRRSL